LTEAIKLINIKILAACLPHKIFWFFMGNIFKIITPSTVNSVRAEAGFKFGEKGTHSSRTMMLEELRSLLKAVSGKVNKIDYAHSVVEENSLGKRTLSTRKESLQRLKALYGLDPELLYFKVMRDLWDVSEDSQPLLALLLSIARDPLLRISATPVIETPFGKEFSRQTMTDALTEETEDRFNASTLDKIVRNASSSWTQSGHLEGRARKFRTQVHPTPVVCAFALFIAYSLGLRGQDLFDNPWGRVLDLDSADFRELADDAKRMGFLNIKSMGTIIEVSFPQFLDEKNKEMTHGTH
jgi:hypothetical protein